MEDDNVQRVEYTRIGFGIIGKMLDTLAKEPNDALIVLALAQGGATISEIADITGLEYSIIQRNLLRLIQTKAISFDSSRTFCNRDFFGLTETGKMLVKAWIAFMKNATIASILPKEDRDRIKEIIEMMEQ